MRQGLVLIGRVTGAHGVQGELKVHLHSGEPANFLCYNRVLLAADEDAAPIAWKVARARVQKEAVIVRLENCTSRTAAEQLARSQVYVHKQDLPAPSGNEFYLHLLPGSDMKTEDGKLIGRIIGIASGGSRDFAQVNDGTQEHLIPLIPEFIIAARPGEVRVSLPPGLLEINN